MSTDSVLAESLSAGPEAGIAPSLAEHPPCPVVQTKAPEEGKSSSQLSSGTVPYASMLVFLLCGERTEQGLKNQSLSPWG